MDQPPVELYDECAKARDDHDEWVAIEQGEIEFARDDMKTLFGCLQEHELV